MIKLILFIFLTTATARADGIALIDIKGTINPGSSAFIQTAISKAQNSGRNALILRLNTPGGLLSSTRDIVQAISAARIPVIIYIAPSGASATSAGAIISIAAHVVAVAPGTNIGAAHPVNGDGKDIKGDMALKVTNDTAALVRSQATLRGRNPQIAEDLVKKSLSFSATEAVAEKIAELEAQDLDDLLAKLDGRELRLSAEQTPIKLRTKGQTIEKISMTWGQSFLHILADPNISTMLLTLGGIAIYAEVNSGFTVVAPGVFGALCLLLAFVSMQMLPINVGGALLLVLGVVLLILEAFIVSHGVLAIGGILSVAAGALFLIDPMGGGSIPLAWHLLGPALAGIGLVTLAIAYALKKSASPQTFDALLGQIATVKEVATDGHHGTALVLGELWNFSCDQSVEPGDSVQVHNKKDLQLLTRRI